MKRIFLAATLITLLSCKKDELPQQTTLDRDSLVRARKTEEQINNAPSKIIPDAGGVTIKLRNNQQDLDSLFKLSREMKDRKPEQLLKLYLAMPPMVPMPIPPHLADPTDVKKIVATDSLVVFEYVPKISKLQAVAVFEKVRRPNDSVWVLDRIEHSGPKNQ
jgi:hypothetical protein